MIININCYAETVGIDHELVVVALKCFKACEKTFNLNEDESYVFALELYEKLNKSACECGKE